jgi:hypothetical protein
MQKLMRDSLCIRSADIMQPFLLVFANSCINIRCSKLLYAVLNRNDSVVANMLVDKMVYKYEYKYCALMANVCIQKDARS